MTNTDIPLLLFAKAPIAGKVKTRLVPDCSPQQAAEIAKILLDEAARVASEYWPGQVKLAVWLDQDDAYIQSVAHRYSLQIVAQPAGHLGEKMHGCFEAFGYPAAIMGCDAPHVLGTTLLDTHRNLSDGQSVLAPSDDGGYYLIGLSESSPTLFNGIRWGGETVLKDTLQKAEQQPARIELLPSLNDIDTWQDVLAVVDQLPRLAAFLQSENLIAKPV